MKLIKFHTLLGLKEASIRRKCVDVIPPPEYPKSCANGGGLEHKSLLFHHIPRAMRDS